MAKSDFIRVGQKSRYGQLSFHTGVISPEAAGRADVEEYRSALSLAKNWLVGKTGALIKRPGFVYCGPAKYADKKAVLIPFDWGQSEGDAQTYVLEVGDEYMRIWKNGGQVAVPVDDGLDLIAGTYQWDASGEGSNQYYLSDAGADPDLEQPLFVFEDAVADPEEMLFGNIYDLQPGEWAYGDADTLGYMTIYVRLSDNTDPDSKADGYLKACYPAEIALPYTEDEVEAVKNGCVQSADVLKLAHENHPPAELCREDHHDWSHDDIEFGSADLAPKLLDLRRDYDGTSEYRYAVTAELANGLETVALLTNWISSWELAKYNRYLYLAIETKHYQTTAKYPTTYWPRDDVVAYHIYRMSAGDEYRWPQNQWGWMRRIDVLGEFWDRGLDGIYAPDHVNSLNPFELDLSGSGKAYPLENDQLGVVRDFEGWEGSGTCGAGYDFSWLLTEEAVFDCYGVGGDDFRLQLKGTGVDFDASGWTITNVGTLRIQLPIRWKDSGQLDPDFASVPILVDSKPFEGEGNYPRCAAFYGERLFYASTKNAPQGLWASQPGNYNAFNTRFPITDSDAIYKALPARQANRIRSLIPQDSLLVGTSGGITRVWAEEELVSPRTIQARGQSEQGVSALRPLMVGTRALYASDSGSKVINTIFDLVREGYKDVELSIRADHLIGRRRFWYWNPITDESRRWIVDWCYSEEPYSFIPIAMSDGALLGFTVIPEEGVWAWFEMPTDGFVESFACVREGGVSAVYALVARTSRQGSPLVTVIHRGVERMALEPVENVAEAIALDAALHWEANAIPEIGFNLSSPLQFFCWPVDAPSENDVVVIGNFIAEPGYENQENADGYTVDYLNGRRFYAINVNAGGPIASFNIKDVSTDYIVNGGSWKVRYEDIYCAVAVTNCYGLRHLSPRLESSLADNAKNVYAVTNGFDPANGNEPWQVSIIQNPAIDENGVVTLPYPATHATFGFGYVAEAQTLNLQGGPGPDAIQNIPKHIGKVLVRVKDTVGLKVGNDPDSLVDLRASDSGDSGYPVEVPGALEDDDTTPILMINGDGIAEPSGGWKNHGRVYIRHDKPVPATVLAIVPELEYGT